jgi:hypothetical protein
MTIQSFLIQVLIVFLGVFFALWAFSAVHPGP